MSTAEQDHVAILVASVVGYDRLRKLNASGAGDRLDRALRTVTRIAKDRGGRLFSGSDDAALEVAFASAVDAIEAALEIQDTLAKHNAELAATDHLECGIGIALGPAVIEGQALGGEAALVARGLTRRARPSTTIVARSVFRRVQPHLHFSYRRHGQHFIPAIAGPVEAYQIKKAPPAGGHPRRRHWARLTRRGAAQLSALAAAAFTRPAVGGHRWLAAAGLALVLIAVGVVTRTAYQHRTVEPEGAPPPMTAMVEPGPAGPSVAAQPAGRPTESGSTAASDGAPLAARAGTEAAAPPPAETEPRPASMTEPAATEAGKANGSPASAAAGKSPGAGRGASTTGVLAALRAALFPEPEPRVVEPAAAPSAAEAPRRGDQHPEIGAEVKTAALVDRGQAEPPAADKRSIVVLPFANASGDPARDYFSAGVTETLTNSLTRFPHLKVIASESAVGYKDGAADPVEIGKDLGVRYILDGTATRTDDDLVLTAQLIDTSTTDQVWQPDYTVRSGDPSAAEGMLIQRVLLSLDGRDPKSAPSDGPDFAPVGTVSLEAYDYALQWRSLFDQSREADNVRAREAALRAVELDQGYAAAYAYVAWTYLADYWSGWSKDRPQTVQQALRWATRGLEHDPRDYNAHWALGDVYQALGEYDKSVAAYETALAINPEVAGLLEDFGTWMLPLQGRAKEGVAFAEKAMALNPHHPDSYYGDIAFNYYLLGDYDDAIGSVHKIEQPRLDHRLYLAASYAQANRAQEAKVEIAKVLKERDNLTVAEFLATYPFKNEADREHLKAGLQEAGLPPGQNK